MKRLIGIWRRIFNQYIFFRVSRCIAKLNIECILGYEIQPVIGIDTKKNDIRFVEDDWENPSVGASGRGFEVWFNGMEITQFTYMQQIGGIECEIISGEITYGLERRAMLLQEVDDIFSIQWNNSNGKNNSDKNVPKGP